MSYHDKKFDQGKPPMYQGLLQYFATALEAVANVSQYGFKKYGSWGGWRSVPDAEKRYMDALIRHLTAHAKGETIDPESKLPHLQHVAWNALAVVELDSVKEEDPEIKLLKEWPLP